MVNFLWNSPENGLLYTNRIVWNGYGDPIKLTGIKIEENGLSHLYLKVFPDTPSWKSLGRRLTDYQAFYRGHPIAQHIFGELRDYTDP